MQAGLIKEIAVFNLQELGWCEFFRTPEAHEPQRPYSEPGGEGFPPDLVPARVAEENRGLYRLFCEPGEFLAELSGKLRHAAESRADLPVVGDWVLAQLRLRENRATIHRVLGRKGKFSRKTAGRKTEEQVIAANIDVLFLVSSLNRD